MEASAVPEIPYSALVERLSRGGLPCEAVLETTFRCNLRCAHCYVNEPAAAPDVRSREMSLPRLRHLLDELAEAGVIHLLLTGGEPLLRPDFEALYVHAIRSGFLVTVFTNGTLVTDTIADLLDRYRPRDVEITLYGATRETYERITGIPGSHGRCMAGIERLLTRKVPFGLKTMLLTWNLHEVEAMRELARSQGLTFRFDPHLNARLDCGASRVAELQLRPEQVLALEMASSASVVQEYRRLCAEDRSPREAASADEPLLTCGAGESTITVDPYGRLHPCVLLRRSSFDLNTGSFREGCLTLIPSVRARTWQTQGPCRRCSLASLCGSCPGAAEVEHGDTESAVAAFCKIAHLRADAAMGAASGHRPDATCCLGEENRPTLSAEAHLPDTREESR